ncbi:MAG TPA: hypothetical protein VF121_07985 [Thermoanaerobaculia bacterium]|nr:hypothetical protein [Thermoanaerobaculia bacterium]
MFGRSVPRLAAALALAAVLVTALPLAAVGPPRAGDARHGGESWIESVWDLIAEVWGGVTAIWARGGGGMDPNGGPPSAQCDGGGTIDPLGCPARPQGDGGIGIDPDG